MKKHILIFLSISIIFTACDARARNGVSDTTNATPTLEKEYQETNSRITSYQGRDRKKVKKHLEQYPMNFDDLKETDVFVNTSSYALRKEKLNDFIESVQRGENKSVDIVTFTIEGDPVLVYIQYNGKNFYCYESFENDSYAAKSARQFNGKNYKYMYLWDIPDEEFGDIDLSKMDTGFQQFVLSNEKLGDYSTFKKMKDDSYSIKVSPFNSEKAVKEYLQRSNK